MIGNVKEDIQHYDLMNIVMLCLGSSDNIEDNALGMLNTLLSDTMSSSERIEILDKKFDFDMSPDDKKEVSEMCNVSRGVLDKGMALGRKEGMALGMDKGIDKSTLNSISKMMATFNVTVDRAMDILEVPDEKREYYKSQISSD